MIKKHSKTKTVNKKNLKRIKAFIHKFNIYIIHIEIKL